MSSTAWIIVIVVLILAVAVAWAVLSRARRARQTEALRGRFGSEYDHAERRTPGRRAVEQRLTAIGQQRDTLDVRTLPESARTAYGEQWQALQAGFVDEPGRTVTQADELMNAVLRERGYPLDVFDDLAALLATDHPDVIANYRAAHEVHARQLKTGRADTEALRLAFLQYRSVFGALTREEHDAPVDLTEGVRGKDT